LFTIFHATFHNFEICKYYNLCKDKKNPTDIKHSGGLRVNDELLTTFSATFPNSEICKYYNLYKDPKKQILKSPEFIIIPLR
jgi:hypothetical protein